MLKETIARELGVSPVVAQILINRGFGDVDSARSFLSASMDDLGDPFLFEGMGRAVDRISRAVLGDEKILIYGDYDVDGVTSVSVLMRLLLPLARGRLYFYIPNRLEEGYGLNLEAVEKAARNGISVIITVDCGISAVKEAEAAQKLGVDLIITDHHEPPSELPPAFSIMDPKMPGCAYPFSSLAGVGMAFKLATALASRLPISRERLEAVLDLVALGTVADIVPLVGENRILVKYGLEQLNRTTNEGLKALVDVCGLQGRDIGTGHLGFSLAPRINATGRLGNSYAGVQLFLTNDPQRAAELARELDGENRRRQQIEADLLDQAARQAETQMSGGDRRTLVLAGEGWHHGVIGIVASKIVDRFYRPAIMIGFDGPEGRGSGRGIPGFHLYRALKECAPHLVKFGGHEFAAGLSIERGSLEAFSAAFENHARTCLRDEDLIPSLRVDAEIELSEATLDLARQIDCLAPHGPSNPQPILVCRDVCLASMKGVGENGKHLKVQARKGTRQVDGIGFGMGEYMAQLPQGSSVSIAFSLEENLWNGNSSVQLNLKDIKATMSA